METQLPDAYALLLAELRALKAELANLRERLGRKCRAVEISPAYVAVAIQRWVDVTGKEPVLLTL